MRRLGVFGLGCPGTRPDPESDVDISSLNSRMCLIPLRSSPRCVNIWPIISGPAPLISHDTPRRLSTAPADSRCSTRSALAGVNGRLGTLSARHSREFIDKASSWAVPPWRPRPTRRLFYAVLLCPLQYYRLEAVSRLSLDSHPPASLSRQEVPGVENPGNAQLRLHTILGGTTCRNRSGKTFKNGFPELKNSRNVEARAPTFNKNVAECLPKIETQR